MHERVLFPRPDHLLSDAAPEPSTERLRYVPTTGVEAGGPVMWFGDVAPDQRPSDAFSLVYETPPLDAEVEILGLPRALLQVAADAPQVNWFARLNDVAPDGTVTLVTAAGQNGAHRVSARDPRAIVAGEQFPLEIEMHFTSWVFPKGHRLRLAVSNAQWPMLWTTPYPTITTLYLGPEASRLMLPVAAPRASPGPSYLSIQERDDVLPGFEPIDAGTPSGYGEISSVERYPQTGAAKVVATNNSATRYPWGEQYDTESITHEANDNHPEATSVRGEYSTTVKLKDRTLRWQSTVVWHSDRDHFYYTGTRRLLKDDVLVREKKWQQSIPRDHQ